MARHNPLPVEAQVAAVKTLLEGKTLDDVEKQYPQLKDGVAALREQPAPRRSGATAPVRARRPRSLR